MVAFHAVNGRVDNFDVGAVLFEDTIANALDGRLAGVWVANYASFADVLAAGFELGLDEDYGFAAPGLVWCAERAKDGGEDEGG